MRARCLLGVLVVVGAGVAGCSGEPERIAAPGPVPGHSTSWPVPRPTSSPSPSPSPTRASATPRRCPPVEYERAKRAVRGAFQALRLRYEGVEGVGVTVVVRHPRAGDRRIYGLGVMVSKLRYLLIGPRCYKGVPLRYWFGGKPTLQPRTSE